MHPALPMPKLVSGLAALFSAVSSSHFLAVATPHNLAAELGSTQMANAYDNGTFPSAKWLVEADSVALRQLAELRRVLKKSAQITIGIAAVVAIALFIFGKIDLSLPIDSGKLVTAAGVFAATWASVLQFHPVNRTFRGNFVHEVAHDAAVRAFFVCGALLGAVGALWWE